MAFVAPNLACGEARGGRIPCHWAVTDEQRSHRPNSAQPGGRQVFFAQTSLLARYRSTAGYARRSRLVWAKNPLPRTSSYLCLRPLGLEADRLSKSGEAVLVQPLSQTGDNSLRHARPFINQAGVELHQRCAGGDFLPGILRVED